MHVCVFLEQIEQNLEAEEDELDFKTEEEENQDFKTKFADILKELDIEDKESLNLIPLRIQDEADLEYGGPGEDDLDEMIGFLEGSKEKKVKKNFWHAKNLSQDIVYPLRQ